MPTTPAPRGSTYVDPTALAAHVREYRRTGVVSDALGRALLAIAGGVWEKYHHTPSKEDFEGAGVLHLLGAPVRNADPKGGNLFNYFTKCLVRFGQKLRDRQIREHQNFQRYAEDLARAGRLGPRDGHG